MNTSNRLEDEEGLPRKVRYLMFEAFATRHNRNRTAVWIAVCCILSAAAAIEGISDNLPGILLAFGAAIALVLAFVHPWRSATKFRNYCSDRQLPSWCQVFFTMCLMRLPAR